MRGWRWIHAPSSCQREVAQRRLAGLWVRARGGDVGWARLRRCPRRRDGVSGGGGDGRACGLGRCVELDPRIRAALPRTSAMAELGS